jgi:ethanolamine utilization protein EutA (predicted chaperonin)
MTALRVEAGREVHTHPLALASGVPVRLPNQTARAYACDGSVETKSFSGGNIPYEHLHAPCREVPACSRTRAAYIPGFKRVLKRTLAENLHPNGSRILLKKTNQATISGVEEKSNPLRYQRMHNSQIFGEGKM